MKGQRVIGTCVGIGIISLLLGILLGWKLHGVKLRYLKKRREYHAKKAEELQNRLI
jgi:hypothetical protein